MPLIPRMSDEALNTALNDAGQYLGETTQPATHPDVQAAARRFALLHREQQLRHPNRA